MAINNFNISVEKRKNNVIIPVILVAIIILIGVIGLIVSGNKGNGNANTATSSNDQLINIYEDKQEKLAKEEARKREEEKKAKLDAVYEKFKDASWASKTDNEKVKLFVIKDKKIFYENGSISEEIPFDKGTPKYIRTIIYGGAMSYFTFVTEEGEAFIVNVDSSLNKEVWLSDGTIDSSKLKFEKLNIKTKVIDIALNMPYYTVKNTYPYYLTEDATVVNRDLKTFEEINRKHIISVSDIVNDVFVNSDTSIEVLRNYESLDYIDVKNTKGEIIKAKYVFKSNNDFTTFYVIDETQKFYTFSSNSVFVASIYPKFNAKTINSVVYDKGEKTVTVKSEDGGVEVFENINQYVYVSDYIK